MKNRVIVILKDIINYRSQNNFIIYLKHDKFLKHTKNVDFWCDKLENFSKIFNKRVKFQHNQ